MRSFSSKFIDAPGDCSPSRNVVSKMMTRLASLVPLMGLIPSFNKVRRYSQRLASPERLPRCSERRSEAPKSKAPKKDRQKDG